MFLSNQLFPLHLEMDLPVCLIENTADGKIQVNAKATDILSKITQPVVVVAIVGLYRTGKSYLMNKLAGSQKGESGLECAQHRCNIQM